jgi:hypothetical protein
MGLNRFRALRRYLDEEHRAELRRQLAEGYRRNRRLSRELAEQWRPLEEETWLREGR